MVKPELSPAELRELIQAARGTRRCDLAIRGGRVVNVFTGDIDRLNVGILHGRIAAVTEEKIDAERVVDVSAMYVIPGFIDGHMHLESSMLTPAEFARVALPLGTTSVVVDPHEIANVVGADGVREMMRATEALPLTFYFTISPCVPTSELDTSGARLGVEDVCGLIRHPRVVGIGEMMDFPGILEGREDLLEKMDCKDGGIIDGHCPGLTGRDLQAYAAAGITSDHEVTEAAEGLEKLRAGMYLMIREGSAARNLDDLVGLVNSRTAERCLLVTDDLQPTDLSRRGHMNYLVSRAVARGVDPVDAIRMASLNTAQRFRLGRLGAVAPGYGADLGVVEDLLDFRAALVVSGGRIAAREGNLEIEVPPSEFSSGLTSTVHLPALSENSFAIRVGAGSARVIEAVEDQLITRRVHVEPAVTEGHVVADTRRDLLKIAVIERHGKSGSIGLGLVKGFGLRHGAIASSVAHDSHNVVVVGASDRDMLAAVRAIGEMNGGLVVTRDGRTVARLPLPIAGLMSDLPAGDAAERLRAVEEAARSLGCPMAHPFGTLSFMCLSVIPELKLTAVGLVDVQSFRTVTLFDRESEQP